jgi:WD40 repeat protein
MDEEEEVALSYEPFEYDFEIETDSTLCFFRRRGRLPLARLSVPGKRPTCLDLSRKYWGPLAGIGFNDGAILIACDLCDHPTRFERTRFLLPHSKSVTSIAFHHTDLIVASSSIDGTLAIHTCESGQWRTLHAVCAAPISALCWRDDRLLAGTINGTVGLWAAVKREWRNEGDVKVHDGRVKLMVSLVNVPNHPVASCGDDLRLKFLSIDGSNLKIDSELSAFPGPFEKIQYDHARRVLRIACCGLPEYSWIYEADGKWRQTQDLN